LHKQQGKGELKVRNYYIGTKNGQELAPEAAEMVTEGMRESMECFKVFCETGGK
jgi:hypothetical protein